MSEHVHCGKPMVSIEFRDIYDGTACWACVACAVWVHRFSEGDRRRPLVEAAMRAQPKTSGWVDHPVPPAWETIPDGMEGAAAEDAARTTRRGCDHKFIDSRMCLKCGWMP